MHRGSRFKPLGSAGITKTGAVFTVAIFGLLVFAGSQILPFYYNYLELEGLMEAQARKASVFTDAQIHREIWHRIKELEIPVDDPDELQINRADGKIIIDLKYEEVFYIDLGSKFSYDIYVFKFNPHVEQQY